VTLEQIAARVGVFFRALGGEGALRVEAAEATAHGARRGWAQRIAGTGTHAALAWRDDEALRLPPVIDVFSTRELNRDLYFWLAALAATDSLTDMPWFERNRVLTQTALERWPGLRARYDTLVQAQLDARPPAARLSADEAEQERAIASVLRDPWSPVTWKPTQRAPAPVHLWLHPDPPRSEAAAPAQAGSGGEGGEGGRVQDARDRRRRRAQRVAPPKREGGLIAMRMEALFGRAEFINVDRATEENDDMDEAQAAADDLDHLSVTQDGHSSASRIRFDLDLPSAACDDLFLGDGIRLPEWDYRRGAYHADYCLLQPMVARDAEPAALPASLRRTARRIRDQFQALAPLRTWHCAQEDGVEVDLEAYTRFTAERQAGGVASAQRVYRDLRGGSRELACLLLADLSLSTDTAVNNEARVIDVVRDALFLFSEALSASGDRFALFGFSSRRRDHVRFHLLKGFGERYGERVRGRIAAIRPGFYTRMGAAIRHATALLEKQAAQQRLLLILTDGKPNDLDRYEGRYGIEDTRMAVLEARRKGLQPFCVTIDARADEYLPHLFGNGGFVVIKRPEELPGRLPQLYAQLTRQ
jgi:nitric oxide reductase NorD protein